MEINTNHFFRMGSSHKVCEDYSVSSSADLFGAGIAYVAVGDGCSVCLDQNNKPITAHTDFGSRLMIRSAADVLCQKHRDMTHMHNLILQQAYNWSSSLKFPRHTLSSTLLLGQLLDENLIVTMAGDGVVAARQKKTKKWGIFEIDFLDKAGKPGAPPYYLRYELKPEDRDLYLGGFGGIQQTFYSLNLKSNENPDSVVRVLKCVPDNTDPHTPRSFFLKWVFHTNTYDMVALFSDGIQTFTDTSPEHSVPKPLSVIEVAREFLAIKGTRGEFVYRRCNKAMQKYAKMNISHSDDFSMAVLKVDN